MTGEWADRLNLLPRFVASRSLEGALEWNEKLIEGDVTEGVQRLKEELDGDLLLIGCGELARHLQRVVLAPAPAQRRKASISSSLLMLE
jgi:hypothetical protein